MNKLSRYIPIIGWLLQYKKGQLQGDLFAGLTVGIMLIPQGMAYALIAGLPPVYGLYASVVPQIIYAILGTSRQLSVAPVAMDSLLVAAGVSVLATEGTEAYIAFAIMLATIMGAMQLLLGLLKLGFITNLLARPVISGFTSAAALIIGFNQLKYLMGVEIVKSTQLIDIIWDVLQKIGQTHWLTFLVGIGGILTIMLVKRIHASIPGSLIAVVLGIAITYFLGFAEAGLSIVRDIPQGLPSFQWPALDWQTFEQLAPLAITISIVAFMEAFSVAKAIEAQKRNYKVVPNQELVALGAANMVGSFFQSYPVTGGFSRSAVNFQSGAQTPMASIISAVLVGLTLLFLTPLFYYLPEAILASIIMVAVVGLIDLGYARQLWQDNKLEFGLLLLTFLSTLHFGMVPGIATGIVFSILILLYKSAYPHIARLGRVSGHKEFRNIQRFKDLEVWADMLIIRVDAPLTFINIQHVKEYIETALYQEGGKVQTIIWDFGPVSYIDATATQALKELWVSQKEKNIRFVICDLIGPVRDIFHASGLIKIVGEVNIMLNLDEAVRQVKNNEQPQSKAYALQTDYKM